MTPRARPDADAGPGACARASPRAVSDSAPIDAPVRAYLAVGSNLGDRRATILGAIDRLARIDSISVVAVSTLIETEPVGMSSDARAPEEGPSPAPGRPAPPRPRTDRAGPFLNGAVAIDTALAPHVLLEKLLAIEVASGRQRREGARYQSRTLDLDLLLYGEHVIRSERLTVPHPRMHERRFVLAPLAEIAPEAVHPRLGRSVQSLLASLDPP